MIKTVIIDDETKARNLIESIIQNNFKNIEICAKASSAVEGIKAIVKYNPDIVFLDIEMNDGTGFDVLDAIPERNFDFMFVTAYNQYAIKAFKYSAIDYIVKPIDIDEFCDGVTRILKSRTLNLKVNLNTLKENLTNTKPEKLVVSSLKGYEYVNLQDILKFEADGRYTKIILVGGRDIVATKTLGEFKELINDLYFFQPHKSYLINLNHVRMFIKQDGGSILMEDGSSVPLSRNKKDEFLQVMKQFTS